MRNVTSPMPSSYERLEDVVSQQLHLSDAVGQSRKIYDGPERRQCFRCRLQMYELDAVLFRDGIGQRRKLVQLIDQSSGGFGVAFQGKETFRRGQIFTMETQAGSHEVRVAYALYRKRAIRVGLERLGDNPEVSGVLSTGALFLIVTFASMSIFTLALLAK